MAYDDEIQTAKPEPHNSPIGPRPLGRPHTRLLSFIDIYSRPFLNPLFHPQTLYCSVLKAAVKSAELWAGEEKSVASGLLCSDSWVLSPAGILSKPAFGPRPQEAMLGVPFLVTQRGTRSSSYPTQGGLSAHLLGHTGLHFGPLSSFLVRWDKGPAQQALACCSPPPHLALRLFLERAEPAPLLSPRI